MNPTKTLNAKNGRYSDLCTQAVKMTDSQIHIPIKTNDFKVKK